MTPIIENQEAGWAQRIAAGDSATEQELLLPIEFEIEIPDTTDLQDEMEKEESIAALRRLLEEFPHKYQEELYHRETGYPVPPAQIPTCSFPSSSFSKILASAIVVSVSPITKANSVPEIKRNSDRPISS